MVSGADSRRHGHGHHGPAARLPDDERNSNTYCQVRVLNFCFQRMISDDFTYRGRHAGDGRQKMYSFYFHRGERVCRKTFCFLHSMFLLTPFFLSLNLMFLSVASFLISKRLSILFLTNLFLIYFLHSASLLIC